MNKLYRVKLVIILQRQNLHQSRVADFWVSSGVSYKKSYYIIQLEMFCFAESTNSVGDLCTIHLVLMLTVKVVVLPS